MAALLDILSGEGGEEVTITSANEQVLFGKSGEGDKSLYVYNEISLSSRSPVFGKESSYIYATFGRESMYEEIKWEDVSISAVFTDPKEFLKERQEEAGFQGGGVDMNMDGIIHDERKPRDKKGEVKDKKEPGADSPEEKKTELSTEPKEKPKEKESQSEPGPSKETSSIEEEANNLYASASSGVDGTPYRRTAAHESGPISKKYYKILKDQYDTNKKKSEQEEQIPGAGGPAGPDVKGPETEKEKTPSDKEKNYSSDPDKERLNKRTAELSVLEGKIKDKDALKFFSDGLAGFLDKQKGDKSFILRGINDTLTRDENTLALKVNPDADTVLAYTGQREAGAASFKTILGFGDKVIMGDNGQILDADNIVQSVMIGEDISFSKAYFGNIVEGDNIFLHKTLATLSGGEPALERGIEGGNLYTLYSSEGITDALAKITGGNKTVDKEGNLHFKGTAVGDVIHLITKGDAHPNASSQDKPTVAKIVTLEEGKAVVFSAEEGGQKAKLNYKELEKQIGDKGASQAIKLALEAGVKKEQSLAKAAEEGRSKAVALAKVNKRLTKEKDGQEEYDQEIQWEDTSVLTNYLIATYGDEEGHGFGILGDGGETSFTNLTIKSKPGDPVQFFARGKQGTASRTGAFDISYLETSQHGDTRAITNFKGDADASAKVANETGLGSEGDDFVTAFTPKWQRLEGEAQLSEATQKSYRAKRDGDLPLKDKDEKIVYEDKPIEVTEYPVAKLISPLRVGKATDPFNIGRLSQEMKMSDGATVTIGEDAKFAFSIRGADGQTVFTTLPGLASGGGSSPGGKVPDDKNFVNVYGLDGYEYVYTRADGQDVYRVALGGVDGDRKKETSPGVYIFSEGAGPFRKGYEANPFTDGFMGYGLTPQENADSRYVYGGSEENALLLGASNNEAREFMYGFLGYGLTPQDHYSLVGRLLSRGYAKTQTKIWDGALDFIDGRVYVRDTTQGETITSRVVKEGVEDMQVRKGIYQDNTLKFLGLLQGAEENYSAANALAMDNKSYKYETAEYYMEALPDGDIYMPDGVPMKTTSVYTEQYLDAVLTKPNGYLEIATGRAAAHFDKLILDESGLLSKSYMQGMGTLYAKTPHTKGGSSATGKEIDERLASLYRHEGVGIDDLVLFEANKEVDAYIAVTPLGEGASDRAKTAKEEIKAAYADGDGGDQAFSRLTIALGADNEKGEKQFVPGGVPYLSAPGTLAFLSENATLDKPAKQVPYYSSQETDEAGIEESSRLVRVMGDEDVLAGVEFTEKGLEFFGRQVLGKTGIDRVLWGPLATSVSQMKDADENEATIALGKVTKDNPIHETGTELLNSKGSFVPYLEGPEPFQAWGEIVSINEDGARESVDPNTGDAITARFDKWAPLVDSETGEVLGKAYLLSSGRFYNPSSVSTLLNIEDFAGKDNLPALTPPTPEKDESGTRLVLDSKDKQKLEVERADGDNVIINLSRSEGMLPLVVDNFSAEKGFEMTSRADDPTLVEMSGRKEQPYELLAIGRRPGPYQIPLVDERERNSVKITLDLLRANKELASDPRIKEYLSGEENLGTPEDVAALQVAIDKVNEKITAENKLALSNNKAVAKHLEESGRFPAGIDLTTQEGVELLKLALNRERSEATAMAYQEELSASIELAENPHVAKQLPTGYDINSDKYLAVLQGAVDKANAILRADSENVRIVQRGETDNNRLQEFLPEKYDEEKDAQQGYKDLKTAMRRMTLETTPAELLMAKIENGEAGTGLLGGEDASIQQDLSTWEKIKSAGLLNWGNGQIRRTVMHEREKRKAQEATGIYTSPNLSGVALETSGAIGALFVDPFLQAAGREPYYANTTLLGADVKDVTDTMIAATQKVTDGEIDGNFLVRTSEKVMEKFVKNAPAVAELINSSLLQSMAVLMPVDSLKQPLTERSIYLSNWAHNVLLNKERPISREKFQFTTMESLKANTEAVFTTLLAAGFINGARALGRAMFKEMGIFGAADVGFYTANTMITGEEWNVDDATDWAADGAFLGGGLVVGLAGLGKGVQAFNKSKRVKDIIAAAKKRKKLMAVMPHLTSAAGHATVNVTRGVLQDYYEDGVAFNDYELSDAGRDILVGGGYGLLTGFKGLRFTSTTGKLAKYMTGSYLGGYVEAKDKGEVFTGRKQIGSVGVGLVGGLLLATTWVPRALGVDLEGLGLAKAAI